MGLLFFLYPFAEIAAWWFFIANFGFGDALLWCLLSALVGSIVLKLQGGAALSELQLSAQQGRLPSRKVAHHLLMSLGGVLLLLPGVLTDLFGALLILPGTRHLLVWFVYWRTGGMLAKSFGMGPFGRVVFTHTVFRGGSQPQGREPRDVTPANQDVLDVKATVLSDSSDDR
jgi:UPF0716 family protein affecting phage T7 exclusion